MTFSRFEWLNHTQQILMAGGISGAMYWISIYPIDVAKSCIQCAAFTDKEHLYRYAVPSWIEMLILFSSLFRSLRTIVRTEGVGGLWKGFTPCLVRGIPVNAVSFLAFETSRKYLDSLW
jgi:solute carrier family 25 carnitine/acylcarnitine transporter 20/29